MGKDWSLSEGKHHLIFIWDCTKVTSFICLATVMLQIMVTECIHCEIQYCLFPLLSCVCYFLSAFMSSSSRKSQVIFHFEHIFKYALCPNFSIAHRCSEPQEGSILFRPIWVLGGWSGAEVPLRHPLLHLQLHTDVVTAYRKCCVYRKLHNLKLTHSKKLCTVICISKIF